MRKILSVAVAAACCIMLNGQNIKYTNPVYDDAWMSPTVVYNPVDGWYYSLATVDMGDCDYIKSRDLITWEKTGQYPYTEETREQLRSYGACLRSPQIVKIKGKYLLYYSAFNSTDDSRIIVLSSPSLEEFFTFEGVITDSDKSRIDDNIDPFVVADKGQVWMFFGGSDGIFRTRLSSDGLKMARKNDYQHVAGLKASRLRSQDNVFEGCTLYKHKGYWYMFASAGRANDYSYRIVVGRSKRLNGEFTDRDGNPMSEGYANVILGSNQKDHFYGPGQNCEIIKDNRRATYTLYSCRTGSIKGLEGSGAPYSLMLQRVRWDKEGWPYFDFNEQKKDKICFRLK